MPDAKSVKPAKWTNLRVLFDDDVYSVVEGTYEGERRLGERWNGSGLELGFPSVSGHAVWHVVPEFLVVPVLHGILDELASAGENSSTGSSPAVEALAQAQRR